MENSTNFFFAPFPEGLIFDDHDPDLVDQTMNMGLLELREFGKGKTAVCAVYAGFQAPDDVNAEWNTALFSVLNQEVAALRRDGFRVVLLGDFNQRWKKYFAFCHPGIIVQHFLLLSRNFK